MEREVYNIDGQEYIVITQTKENESNDNIYDIYDIFVRYALEKINEKIQ